MQCRCEEFDSLPVHNNTMNLYKAFTDFGFVYVVARTVKEAEDLVRKESGNPTDLRGLQLFASNVILSKSLILTEEMEDGTDKS